MHCLHVVCKAYLLVVSAQSLMVLLLRLCQLEYRQNTLISFEHSKKLKAENRDAAVSKTSICILFPSWLTNGEDVVRQS